MNKIKLKREIEEKIIALTLNEPESIVLIAAKVKPEDFEKKYQELFSEIIKIGPALKESPYLILKLSKMNLESWNITELMLLCEKAQRECLTYSSLLSNKIFEHHIDLTHSILAERLLKDKLELIKKDCLGIDALEELKGEIDILLSNIDNLREEKSFSARIDEIYEEIEKQLCSRSESSFTVKNIPSFNSSTGGGRLTNLIGIAGSYKSGKTSLALNLITDFALQNIPCGFFSLELSQNEIDEKALGIFTGIPYERIREPKKLTDDDKRRLVEYRSKIKSLPLYTATKIFKETEIRTKAQYWKDRFGVKIICIDYLGYMETRKKFDNREREMTYYSGCLKKIAQDLNVLVIVLAQLNRTGKIKPGTENLAESIALARDCDFLFVTYNPLEIGIRNSGGINFTESDFIVKLDTTRHTKYKKQFMLRMQESGKMIEIATEYNNEFLKNGSPAPLSSFYESESSII